MSKFGYPNDEGQTEHPLYNSGIVDAETDVLEIFDSPWAHEITEQMIASARRMGRSRDGLGMGA